MHPTSFVRRALLAVLLVTAVPAVAVESRESAERARWQPVRILCAAQRIAPGKEVDAKDVKSCEIPERFVTDSFVRLDDPDDVSVVLGQKVVVPLLPGDPMLYSHFESARDFVLSESIPTRARGMAIKLGPDSAVGMHVRPNDHVDVIAVVRDEKSKQLAARTVLQNVIVLATGRITGMTVHATDEDRKFDEVTLLVLPDEAELLAVAAASGPLTLSLRNPRDLDEQPPTKPVTLDAPPNVPADKGQQRRAAPEPIRGR